MKPRIAATLIIITVLFQHFQLFSVGGFPITVGLFSGVALVAYASERISVPALAIAIPVITIAAGTAALFSADDADLTSFFRTYALIILGTVIIVAGFGGAKPNLVNSAAVGKALFFCLSAVVALSVAQTIAGSFGSTIFFNVFGQNQYLYNYSPNIAFSPIPRAQGFFLEPSYDAFVIGTLGTALLCLNRRVGLVAVITLAGLAACQSATGLVIFFAVLVFVAARSRPSAFFGIVALASVAIFLSGDYLVGRLNSISSISSSANYRLLAPIEILQDILIHAPFGMPLGSIQEVVASYGLQNGTTVGSSLDNGFYVIVYYFGWIGLAAIVAWLVASASSILNRRSRNVGLAWIAPIWLLCMMFFSGGIVLPEFALMTWIVLVAYQKKANESAELNLAPIAQRNYRQLSGY